MQHNAGDGTLMLAACAVLSFAKGDAWRASAIDAGLLETLIAALLHHARGADIAVLDKLLRLFRELVREISAAERAQAAGGVAAVIAALAANPQESGDVMLAAGFQVLSSLWRADSTMAHGCTVARLVLEAMGNVARSRAAAQPRNRWVNLTCCGLLVQMMLLFDNKRPLPRGIDARECVRAVLTVMRTHQGDGEMQQQAAMALVVLRANAAEGYHACEELGGDEAFAAVLREHPEHAQFLRRMVLGADKFAKRPMCDWHECRATSGGVDETKLRRCSGCLLTRYCSSACQLAHWRAGHKAECRAARDAAQQRTPAGGVAEARGAT